jgi:hypothetical protein
MLQSRSRQAAAFEQNKRLGGSRATAASRCPRRSRVGSARVLEQHGQASAPEI